MKNCTMGHRDNTYDASSYTTSTRANNARNEVVIKSKTLKLPFLLACENN